MNTAKLVKKIEGWQGDARLYEVNPPLENNEFVIVSAVHAMFQRPETYIFPANPDGTVKNFGELDGSFRGEKNHARALNNAGYEIV